MEWLNRCSSLLDPQLYGQLTRQKISKAHALFTTISSFRVWGFIIYYTLTIEEISYQVVYNLKFSWKFQIRIPDKFSNVMLYKIQRFPKDRQGWTCDFLGMSTNLLLFSDLYWRNQQRILNRSIHFKTDWRLSHVVRVLRIRHRNDMSKRPLALGI